MAHARTSHGGYLRCLVLVCLTAGLAGVAASQEASKEPVSLPHTIILPQKIVAGTPATLAVLDFAGRLVPNVSIELSGGRKVITDVTGRALFVAPGEAGKLTAKVAGQEVVASSTVVAIPGFASELSVEGAAAPAQVLSYPRVITIHDRFTIEGVGFRGAADSNHVLLAGEPAVVLASSPVSLVVLPGPHIPVGAIDIRISVAGHDTARIPISAVLLDLSGPVQAPDAGTQGKIIVTVRGSSEALPVEVRNDSPEIVQFPHGRTQRVMTSGGENNFATVELKFVAAGDYTLTARLASAETTAAAGDN